MPHIAHFLCVSKKRGAAAGFRKDKTKTPGNCRLPCLGYPVRQRRVLCKSKMLSVAGESPLGPGRDTASLDKPQQFND